MTKLPLQNVRLAKAALRPGAGNMVNAILRKLVLLKVCFFSSKRNNQVISFRDSFIFSFGFAGE